MIFRSFHQIAAALAVAALIGIPGSSTAFAAKAKQPAETGKTAAPAPAGKKENALTAPPSDQAHSAV